MNSDKTKINLSIIIPHYNIPKLLEKLILTILERDDIQVIVVEEFYTSKIDHLALEPMQKQDNYMGKRIHRGLFKSSTDKVVNADLNGAVGILRKVIDESQFIEIINRGFVTNPVKVNPLAKIFI